MHVCTAGSTAGSGFAVVLREDEEQINHTKIYGGQIYIGRESKMQ
jgi:hypothetical protein